jgi:hypothetical protein
MLQLPTVKACSGEIGNRTFDEITSGDSHR